MDTIDVELLIAKLEAASEGSEELDRAIADAVLVPVEPARLFGSPVDIPMWRYPNGSTGTELRFTRSIDAALTLIPEGAVWHVMTDYGDLNRAKVGPRNNPSASIYNDADRPLFLWADAATPALALCIAALRARLPASSLPETPEA